MWLSPPKLFRGRAEGDVGNTPSGSLGMAVSGFIGVSALSTVIAGLMVNGRNASFCVRLDQEIRAEIFEE